MFMGVLAVVVVVSHDEDTIIIFVVFFPSLIWMVDDGGLYVIKMDSISRQQRNESQQNRKRKH